MHRTYSIRAVALAAVLVPTIFAFFTVFRAPQLLGQSEAGKASAVRAPTPQWQIGAGGKMAFEVASVKQDTTAPSESTVHENIPLGPQDQFAPTGGLLAATNVSFARYMLFAYKLSPTQLQIVRSRLPKWATNDRYDIEARASGNPTKDQFRLMMQALLADRFKLAVHHVNFPFMSWLWTSPVSLGRSSSSIPKTHPAPPYPRASILILFRRPLPVVFPNPAVR